MVVACLNAIKVFGVPTLIQVHAMKKEKETISEESLFDKATCKQL